jgi:arylsulfatase A-like enzyme
MARFPELSWDRQVMAAMISAMDDSVGEIMAELERLGMAQNTFTFFMADNGPSRETRNWLDGTLDAYYGGTAGQLKGHKFSLYDGGIRVPGIMHWPEGISGGQVLNSSCAAMDIFPTMFSAAGGDISAYELDGINLLPYVSDGVLLPERNIYWEQGNQKAVRQGNWKLVLNGQLVEVTPPEDEVHLSQIADDMGEKVNLKDEEPEVVEELTQAVESWCANIEKRWQEEFSVKKQGTVTH